MAKHSGLVRWDAVGFMSVKSVRRNRRRAAGSGSLCSTCSPQLRNDRSRKHKTCGRSADATRIQSAGQLLVDAEPTAVGDSPPTVGTRPTAVGTEHEGTGSSGHAHMTVSSQQHPHSVQRHGCLRSRSLQCGMCQASDAQNPDKRHMFTQHMRRHTFAGSPSTRLR